MKKTISLILMILLAVTVVAQDETQAQQEYDLTDPNFDYGTIDWDTFDWNNKNLDWSRVPYNEIPEDYNLNQLSKTQVDQILNNPNFEQLINEGKGKLTVDGQESAVMKAYGDKIGKTFSIDRADASVSIEAGVLKIQYGNSPEIEISEGDNVLSLETVTQPENTIKVIRKIQGIETEETVLIGKNSSFKLDEQGNFKVTRGEETYIITDTKGKIKNINLESGKLNINGLEIRNPERLTDLNKINYFEQDGFANVEIEDLIQEDIEIGFPGQTNLLEAKTFTTNLRIRFNTEQPEQDHAIQADFFGQGTRYKIAEGHYIQSITENGIQNKPYSDVRFGGNVKSIFRNNEITTLRGGVNFLDEGTKSEFSDIMNNYKGEETLPLYAQAKIITYDNGNTALIQSYTTDLSQVTLEGNNQNANIMTNGLNTVYFTQDKQNAYRLTHEGRKSDYIQISGKRYRGDEMTDFLFGPLDERVEILQPSTRTATQAELDELGEALNQAQAEYTKCITIRTDCDKSEEKNLFSRYAYSKNNLILAQSQTTYDSIAKYVKNIDDAYLALNVEGNNVFIKASDMTDAQLNNLLAETIIMTEPYGKVLTKQEIEQVNFAQTKPATRPAQADSLVVIDNGAINQYKVEGRLPQLNSDGQEVLAYTSGGVIDYMQGKATETTVDDVTAEDEMRIQKMEALVASFLKSITTKDESDTKKGETISASLSEELVIDPVIIKPTTVEEYEERKQKSEEAADKAFAETKQKISFDLNLNLVTVSPDGISAEQLAQSTEYKNLPDSDKTLLNQELSILDTQLKYKEFALDNSEKFEQYLELYEGIEGYQFVKDTLGTPGKEHGFVDGREGDGTRLMEEILNRIQQDEEIEAVVFEAAPTPVAPKVVTKKPVEEPTPTEEEIEVEEVVKPTVTEPAQQIATVDQTIETLQEKRNRLVELRDEQVTLNINDLTNKIEDEKFDLLTKYGDQNPRIEITIPEEAVVPGAAVAKISILVEGELYNFAESPGRPGEYISKSTTGETIYAFNVAERRFLLREELETGEASDKIIYAGSNQDILDEYGELVTDASVLDNLILEKQNLDDEIKVTNQQIVGQEKARENALVKQKQINDKIQQQRLIEEERRKSRIIKEGNTFAERKTSTFNTKNFVELPDDLQVKVGGELYRTQGNIGAGAFQADSLIKIVAVEGPSLKPNEFNQAVNFLKDARNDPKYGYLVPSDVEIEKLDLLEMQSAISKIKIEYLKTLK